MRQKRGKTNTIIIHYSLGGFDLGDINRRSTNCLSNYALSTDALPNDADYSTW